MPDYERITKDTKIVKGDTVRRKTSDSDHYQYFIVGEYNPVTNTFQMHWEGRNMESHGIGFFATKEDFVNNKYEILTVTQF